MRPQPEHGYERRSACRPVWIQLAAAAFLFAVALQLHAADSRPLMREFIGINGHTVQFRSELYRPVCSRVRDYHPVAWDLGTNTAELPPFPFAKNRVDWSKVYGGWRDRGFVIDVSLMFESIAREKWTDVERDARAYGRAFAREFGPGGQRKLVDSVEIGNEPGGWNDGDYARLFRAMAEGIREGDPKLRIVTCNLTTGASGKYEKSVACVADMPSLFDVLNVHSYAQLEGWPTWRRSFPEDPRLAKYLQDVEAVCQWRDTHAPGKPVWVTEFGYDSSTQSPPASGNSAKWVGVTDRQQAQWLVRSLLVFSSMPIERAYIYFFNDDDKPSLHASSGITRHFQPKPSYHALAQLQRVLGDYRFVRVVRDDPGRLRVHEYESGADPERLIWVVWAPNGETESATRILDRVPGKLLDAEAMTLAADAPAPRATGVVQMDDGRIRLEASGSPIYLFLERTQAPPP